MGIPIKNLVVRNKKYYFRSRLPKNYHENLPCEIKISIKTDNLKNAVNACIVTTERLNSIISTKAIGSMTLTEIRKILADSISSSLEEHARLMADYGAICPNTQKDGMQTALNIMEYFENDRKNGNALGKEQAQNILKDTPNVTASDINFMAQEWTLAQIFLARMQHDRIAGKSFLTEYNESIYNEIMSGSYRSAQEIRQSETIHTLGELAEEFLKEKAPTWGIPNLKLNTADLNTLIEYFSKDEDIKAITHLNLINYRNNILKNLPANRTTIPQLKDIPLREVVEIKNVRKISDKTINLMLSRINGFFLWCFRFGYVERNVADGLMSKRLTKTSEERSIFTTEELVSIFTNLREDKLNAWHPYKLLIPLIGLYSGARMAEICQLCTENIFLINGIVCMEITDSTLENASLKNQNSRRIVPIHPLLLRLGFLSYVQKCSKVKRKSVHQLWPLSYSKGYGYSHNYSKAFGNFKNKILPEANNKVFHSFRHNFSDNLKQQGCAELLVKELMGHGSSGETFGRYGKNYNPSIMLETMLKLDYGFDIFGVLGKRPISDEILAKQIEQLPER